MNDYSQEHSKFGRWIDWIKNNRETNGYNSSDISKNAKKTWLDPKFRAYILKD